MNALFDKKTYFALFAGFFLLEAVLAAWTGMGYDMNVWFNTGRWMHQGINIYVPPNHLGYPPMWAFWCNVAYSVYLFFGNNLQSWRFAVKLPLILANLGLAFALGAFASTRFDRKTARRVLLFGLTCSFFIFIGAMWGQINTLSALLTFLSFYALTLGRTKSSAVLLGLATALKIYPLIVLPAFFAYVLKNKNGKEAAKFALYSVAVPVVFTVAVFAAFQWELNYFLHTIFYWTPVYEANPVLIQGGGMNIWSFTSLLKVDISQVGVLRLIWIPVLAAAAIYWLKRPRMDEAALCLSTISFYVLFMITYSWVPEQSFVDPLPFIFLLILAYRPRKLPLYLLVVIQGLVYAFSVVNWGPFVFEPFLQQFYPDILKAISPFNPTNGYVWATRGILGLAVSSTLAVFLLILAKPSLFQDFPKRLHFIRQKSDSQTEPMNQPQSS